AWVEEDDRHVPRVPGDVLEQRRSPEERVERAGAAEEDDGAVGTLGVFVEDAVDLADDVLRQAVRTLDQVDDALLQGAEAARGIGRLDERLLAPDDRVDELGPFCADAREKQGMERDRRRGPPRVAQLLREMVDL